MFTLSTTITVLTISWIVVLLVVQPLAAWVTGQNATDGDEDIDRYELYRKSAVGIATVAGITLVLDLGSGGAGISAIKVEPAQSVLAWSGATLLACLGVWLGAQLVRRWRRALPSGLYVNALPRNTAERVAFSANSVWAGIGEEYAVRGFCLLHLYQLSGSWAVAYVLTTLGFGLGHAYQGLNSTIRTTLAGAVLGAPVVVTGTIIPSIVAHAGMNVASGLWTYPMLEKWGLLETPQQ